MLPARWADLVRRSRPDEMAVQPVYDLALARARAGRVLVSGDAATAARPHTGIGAAKAIQDAMALQHACERHDG